MLSFPGTVRVYRHPPDTENMDISSWKLQAPDFKPFGLIFIILGPFEFIDVPLILNLKDSMRTFFPLGQMQCNAIYFTKMGPTLQQMQICRTHEFSEKLKFSVQRTHLIQHPYGANSDQTTMEQNKLLLWIQNVAFWADVCTTDPFGLPFVLE